MRRDFETDVNRIQNRINVIRQRLAAVRKQVDTSDGKPTESQSDVRRSGAAERIPVIYIVDDEPSVGDVFSIVLKRAGYDPRKFTDPLAALAGFEQAEIKPEVVIADFSMPGMNGLELLRRCKALQPRLRTMSVSGNLREEDIHGIGFRPDRILPKPCDLSALASTVEALLETKT